MKILVRTCLLTSHLEYSSLEVLTFNWSAVTSLASASMDLSQSENCLQSSIKVCHSCQVSSILHEMIQQLKL